MKGIHIIAFILLAIGGINWLLVGVSGWDIGELFNGQDAVVSRVIYVLVGLAAIWEIFTHSKSCKKCSASKPAESSMGGMSGAGQQGGPQM